MVPINYEIRSATNKDIPYVKEIVFTVLKEYNLLSCEDGKDKDLNDIQKNYFDRHGAFWVLIHLPSEKIVGTFGITSNQESVCELRKMFLQKEHRGQKLGKLMLEHALAFARNSGYHSMQLESISVLKEAIELYKSYGFLATDPLEINDRVDCAFQLDLKL